MQPPPRQGPCVLWSWGALPRSISQGLRLPGQCHEKGAATVRGLSFCHKSNTCSCGNPGHTDPPDLRSAPPRIAIGASLLPASRCARTSRQAALHAAAP